jgi:hypothetical protein
VSGKVAEGVPPRIPGCHVPLGPMRAPWPVLVAV